MCEVVLGELTVYVGELTVYDPSVDSILVLTWNGKDVSYQIMKLHQNLDNVRVCYSECSEWKRIKSIWPGFVYSQRTWKGDSYDYDAHTPPLPHKAYSSDPINYVRLLKIYHRK